MIARDRLRKAILLLAVLLTLAAALPVLAEEVRFRQIRRNCSVLSRNIPA